jgi:hypothetical protein
MRRYQFVVGVSLSALEAELSQIMNNEPGLVLREFTYAQGTGFVAVVERSEGNGLVPTEQTERPGEPSKDQRKRRKKS